MSEKLSEDAAAFLSELGASDEDPSKGRAALIVQSLEKESDRGCAIFGAEVLNDDLERLFRAFLRSDATSVRQAVDPLFERYGPLSTFSGRIQLAYAMQILTRGLKQQLDLVRRIRNDFAHQAGPLDFDDPSCRDRVNLLVGGASRQKDTPAEPIQFGEHRISRERFETRLAFAFAIAGLSARIGFLEDVLRAGRDIRSVVTALELKEL